MSAVSTDGCIIVEVVLVETAPRLAWDPYRDFCLMRDLTEEGLRLRYGKSAIKACPFRHLQHNRKLMHLMLPLYS